MRPATNAHAARIKRLRQLRENAGLPRTVVASLIGSQEAVICRIERGAQPASEAYVERLRRGLAAAIAGERGRLIARAGRLQDLYRELNST